LLDQDIADKPCLARQQDYNLSSIEAGIPLVIEALKDQTILVQAAAASSLTRLAKHGKQELETIVAGVTSNECQQSHFIMTSGMNFYP